MNLTNLFFRYPTFRENYCKLRFLIYSRLKNLQEFSSDHVLQKEKSKSSLTNYRSNKNRITYLVKLVDQLVYNKKNLKVLCCGPRFESELFGLQGIGFKKKNISAIDTFSYSPRIKAGDIHNTQYLDDSFDLIIAGWTIAYSNTPLKAMSEFHRILRNGGRLILTWDLPEDYNLNDPLIITLPQNQSDQNQQIKSLFTPSRLAVENFKIYRLEVGKLAFSGHVPFAVVILEKIMIAS